MAKHRGRKPKKTAGKDGKRKGHTRFPKGFRDLSFAQDKIAELRSAPDYQAAEATRQNKGPDEWGSYNMYNGTTTEVAQVRLMIDTWENIANLALGVQGPSRQAIYASTPIRYMWTNLFRAIEKFRVNEPNYASRFEELKDAYTVWLNAQNDSGYTSSVDQGLNAMFG